MTSGEVRETGILDKMAQRERVGVRYVNVERKEETRTAANNGSAKPKTTDKQKRRAFCASWRCGGVRAQVL